MYTHSQQSAVRDAALSGGRFRLLKYLCLAVLPAGLALTSIEASAQDCESFEKQVSIDGGLTWFDADDPSSAPTQVPGGDSEYRFIINNCETNKVCFDTRVKDETLGILDPNNPNGVLVADVINPGDQVIVTKDTPGFENLDQPGQCIPVNTAKETTLVEGATDPEMFTDPAHVKCPLPPPDIDIEKLTNGNQADGANDADVPRIAPGDIVTWTYQVSNTGEVDFGEAEVMVTDDQSGVTPVLDTTSDDGGDLILSQGETWIYTAMSQALDLSTAQGVTVVDGCNNDRPTYENIGKVAVDSFDLMDTDPSHYCNPGNPDIDIRKQAEGSDSRTFPSGSDVPFEIVVTNTGTVDLVNVVVTDILVPQCDNDIGFLAVGEFVSYTCTAPDVTQSFTNEACVSGEDGDGTPVADCDPSTVEIPPAGGEGCTPGFWKQSQHFPAWLNPPYSPSTQFSAVFDNAFPGKTLLQVLSQGGGGLKALGRHTVAALLNAATADVSYDITTQGVIDAFNEVYPGSKSDYNGLKYEFENFNEQGCPINGKYPPSNL